MKKLLAVLLAVAMLFSLSLTAFAAGNDGTVATNGEIKLTPDNTIVSGTKYTLYQILDLESFDKDNESYSYKLAENWADFFKTGAAGADYMTVNKDGYVELKSDEVMNTDTEKQAFARAAIDYATTNNISGTEKTYDGTAPVAWSGLNLGYYVVDSDAGILCNLTTTNTSVEINGKNKVLITKTVKEVADAGYNDNGVIVKIGDTVNFKIEVSVYAGAENYIVHDKMTEGLTLDANSFVLTNATTEITESDYTVATTGLTDGCNFHITFDQNYLDKVSTALNYSIDQSQTVGITYNALVNDKAVIHGTTPANQNDAKLEYGNEHGTEWDSVTVDTYKFDLVKYDGKDNKLLSGAEFLLYAADKTTQIPVVFDQTKNAYRPALTGEAGTNIVVANGTTTVVGLDAELAYYVKEVVAPEGYNLLTEMVEVLMKSGTTTITYQNNTYTASQVGEWHNNDGGVAVENNTGTLLPGTGGTGTTLFIVFGAIVALGAFIVLVARKKSAGYIQ